MEQNNKTNYKGKIELNYYESKELEKKAEKLVKEGNYTEAIEYYTILSEAKPHNLNYKNEIKKLEKIIKEIKKKAEYNYKKAIELKKQGRYYKSIEYFEKAISLDPNNAEYKNKLQKLKNRIERGKQEKAKKCYQKAVTLEKQEKYSKAITYCKKALKLDPTNKEYQKKKEELNLMVKKEERSLKYYKQAIKYEKAKNYEKAIEYYTKAANELGFNKYKNKIIKLYEEIIKGLLEERKCSEVIDCYNKIIRLKPAYSEYYQKKIDRIKNKRKEKEEKKKKQAEELYTKALRYAQIGLYEEAINCCRKAMKLQPNNKKYENEIPKLKIKLEERKKEEEENENRIKNVQDDAMDI